VTNLYNEGTIVDADGKTVTIVGSDGTSYVKGTGKYTITVTGTYSTDADLSGALTAPSWSDYEVSAPSQLTAVSTSASVAVDTSSDTSSSETSSVTSSGTPAEITASDVADSAPENTDIAISADAGAEKTEASGIRTATLIGILAAGAAAAAAAVLLVGRKKK
jgi:hypothetical protein